LKSKHLTSDRALARQSETIPRPELLAALALVLLYAASISGHTQSIDGTVLFRQAISLAVDHSIFFRHPEMMPGPIWTGKYPIGLSVLYMPLIAVVSWLHPALTTAAATGPDNELWKLYLLTAEPAQILIAAGTALLVARVIRRLGGRTGLAMAGMALYGLASPALVYAHMDYAQPLLGLCWMLGIWAGLTARSNPSWGWLAAASLAIFGAVITRQIEGSLLLPVLALMSRRPSAWFCLAAGYVAGLSVDLGIQWWRHGNPLVTGYGNESFSTPILVGLTGSLFSPARGIVWSFPLVLLVPWGLLWLAQQGMKDIAILLPALCVALLVEVSIWWAWWGGYGYGLRLFVPALPVLAVIGTLGLSAISGWLRPWIAGAVFAAGLTWALPCVLTDMNAGYGALADQTSGSWKLIAYPPIGAWQFLHHWRGYGVVDSGSADIIWLREARVTHDLSLVVPLVFLGCAALLGWRAIRSLNQRAWAS
jgi:hypothetical protein